MAELQEGMKAPDFSLPTSGDGTISLKSLRGKKVILYFYPKDDTSGCTKEACAFRDAYDSFTEKGTVIVGVSADPVASHQRFAQKYSLPFILASDEDKKVLKAYGVWKKKSMYGKTYLGIERSTFVIDEKGVIRKIFRKVKVEGHLAEVEQRVGSMK